MHYIFSFERDGIYRYEEKSNCLYMRTDANIILGFNVFERQFISFKVCRHKQKVFISYNNVVISRICSCA